MKLLFTKLLGSVVNSTGRSRLRTRVNFLVRLNCFVLYFYTLPITRSGDSELNLGLKSSLLSDLSICHCNLDSLAAQNFSKVNLREAYNPVHSFDICLSETFSNSTVQLDHPHLLMNDYAAVCSDHTNNVKRGGFCIYYKRF